MPFTVRSLGVILVVLSLVLGVMLFTAPTIFGLSSTVPNQAFTQAGIVSNPLAGITNLSPPIGQPWYNLQNAGVLNGQYAYSNGYGSSQSVSSGLAAQLFNLNIPSNGVLAGILVQVTGFASASNSGSTTITTHGVQLIVAGKPTGTIEGAGSIWPNGQESTIQYGGSSDLWGLTIGPSDVNRLDFGFVISVNFGVCNYIAGQDTYGHNVYSTCTSTANVDFISLTIFYQLPNNQPPPQGSLTTEYSTLNNGAVYTYTYIVYPTTVTVVTTPNYPTSTVVSTVTETGYNPIGCSNCITQTTTSNTPTTVIIVVTTSLTSTTSSDPITTVTSVSGVTTSNTVQPVGTVTTTFTNNNNQQITTTQTIQNQFASAQTSSLLLALLADGLLGVLGAAMILTGKRTRLVT